MLLQTSNKVNPAWYPLRYHHTQAALWNSQARFNVVPAGRRSGKTEICGKRKLIMKALRGGKFPDWRGFAAAPTRDQAKRIYWKDLKRLVPPSLRSKDPSESHLIIYVINGSEVHILGMDKPERVEGTPWDFGVLDEYANMKPRTWTQHVRAALSDRKGGCDFIGVPEGRNHYYDLYKNALARGIESRKKGYIPEWDAFHWISADILDPEEIESAKRDLDELIYQQEYEASFINFSGRAYYNFLEQTHCASLEYNPRNDLIFTFDFNVAPGTACITQEQHLPSKGTGVKRWGSGIVGEVYIPRGSNTVMVCDKLITDWGKHRGRIFCYGDSTGGAKGSAKILGSDWQLIKEKLWSHFGVDRIIFRIPKANPRERDRINSLNSRLLNTKGEVRMMVDPSKAPKTVKDFEGVTVVEGGSGELDKTSNPELTHLTDGCGYYTHREYPVKKIYEPSGLKYWK